MRLLDTTAAIQALSREWHRAGDVVGLVPTMGALHEGHVALVRAARVECDRVAVSIFVNPAQFNDPGDLAAYPVDLEADLELLERERVDAVFHPTVADMYPGGLNAATRVSANPAFTGLEGERRPGHFDGVATVVCRLFNAAGPDRAYFGQKDANQLEVVRALVRDLGFPLEVVGVPTVREPDGLALSSRNRRLTAEQREAALGLVRALAAAQVAAAAGASAAAEAAVMEEALREAPGLRLDYATVEGDRALVAAFAGEVRLIDNASLGDTDLVRFAAPRAAAVGA